MNRQGDRGSALSGYRVLDLTDERGMLCSRYLADMGAEVIRVEKPGGSARSPFFWATNLGKLGITLNVEVEPGQEIFKRLVESADVLVESQPPGYLEALGLGYPQLGQINPPLVMASITDFGNSGPYRDYKSCDMVASALGGQMYVCGEPQSPPLKPFGNQSYYLASIFAAIGILLALWNRHTSGRGQHIDISLPECVAATLDHVLVRYFYQGVIARRQGSLHWNNAFRIFPCRDGYILLSLLQQWETLVEWLDSEGMADDLTDEKWLDRENRLKQLDHIIAVLERWTRSHSVAELVEQGQLMRFPWAEVTSIPGLVNSPQLKERNFFIEVEHPEPGKRYKFPGAPCKLSRSPWRVGSRVPKVGEHNKQIYHGELGLSEEEIEALIKDGVI
ncbi:MAG: CoA transferase [Dehalococcoidia bacterium]|nr:MAG: CoA transferase [Dehalococcoidia bacterium]